MSAESHSAKKAQAYLDQVCAWMEGGRPLSQARKAIRAMAKAGPVAMLAAGLACSGSVESGESEDGAAGNPSGGSAGAETGGTSGAAGTGGAQTGGSAGVAGAGGDAGSGGSSLEAEICDNDVDDDLDGQTDCADPDCFAECGAVDAAYAAPFEFACDDEEDNDYDGLVDCKDDDCIGDPACPETDCENEVDDDQDGKTDCADSDCSENPACMQAAYAAPFE